jgi:putative glutamine amidotransferase
MPSRRRGPIIGVTGPDRKGWALRGFTHFAVRRAGGRAAAVTPARGPDRERLAGLVVAGGADVDPALYGQPNMACRHLDPARDQLEADLLRWAVQSGRPVLAICRGMQLLNVALGGTLHQDAARQYPGFKPTTGLYRQATLRRPVHIIKRGWVADLLGTGRKVHLVNSLHRQAIAEVAPDLEVVAVDEQGMVQALELATKEVFTVGVQWHPELMPHAKVQMSFFGALVEACRRPSEPGA